ncbi:hypothetical protein BJX64DRAFT_215463 [Aspergillus heterothallicus]
MWAKLTSHLEAILSREFHWLGGAADRIFLICIIACFPPHYCRAMRNEDHQKQALLFSPADSDSCCIVEMGESTKPLKIKRTCGRRETSTVLNAFRSVDVSDRIPPRIGLPR